MKNSTTKPFNTAMVAHCMLGVFSDREQLVDLYKEIFHSAWSQLKRQRQPLGRFAAITLMRVVIEELTDRLWGEVCL